MRHFIPSTVIRKATSIVRSDKNPRQFRDKSRSPKSSASAFVTGCGAAQHSGIFQMAIAILARNEFYCKEKYNDYSEYTSLGVGGNLEDSVAAAIPPPAAPGSAYSRRLV